jgi:DNA-binding NtrC family response regulator
MSAPPTLRVINGGTDTGSPSPGPDPDKTLSIRILVIDDERALRESCRTFLRSEGYTVDVCGEGNEALDLLGRRTFDIVMIDQYMSGISGARLLEICLAKHRDTLAIVMTGNPSVESSLQVLRAGAWDYLTKPFTPTQLQILIGRAAHTVLASRERDEAREAVRSEWGTSEKLRILGSAPTFRRVIEQAHTVARTNASVFITGESGTGKEVIAQFIHHHSRRNNRPLVAVNCAALPESLLESEMFGHQKGAFTGALRDKPGLLEIAHGSTMFLDEVLEMSKPIQAKLLRVIQDGVLRRVGSENTDAVVSCRFISATNHDPKKATDSGVFRQDLFYRLYVVPLSLPPLRERPEDIPLLANHFLTHHWDQHRERGEKRPVLSERALQELIRYPWPGNVRELQNLIEHLVVLAKPGTQIQADELPFVGREPRAEPAHAAPAGGSTAECELYHVARERALAEFERGYFIPLVSRAGGNVSRAARMAGIERTTLYRLMEKHAFQPPSKLSEADAAEA